MRHYETTFVVDAHLQDEAIEKSVEKFLKFIEDGGGKLGVIDRWGKRRLAYEIQKKQYGYYVCARYEIEGEFIQELERAFQLDEDILRSLTIQVPTSVLKEEKENPKALETVEPTDDEAVDPVKSDDVKKEEESKEIVAEVPEAKIEEPVVEAKTEEKPVTSEDKTAE